MLISEDSGTNGRDNDQIGIASFLDVKSRAWYSIRPSRIKHREDVKMKLDDFYKYIESVIARSCQNILTLETLVRLKNSRLPKFDIFCI